MSNPAEGYERYMVPVLFAPFASRLLDTASPRTGDRILDLACGTGIVARHAASRLGSGAEITGIDRSAQMLSVARDTAAQQRLRIDWREGRAEALPLAESAFDLVLCQFGLMFFDDRPAAVREMRRVVTDGGRAFILVWQDLSQHPFYETLHRVIERRVGISALQDIFSLGDVGVLRAMFTSAGFDRVEVTPWSMRARFPAPDAFLAGEIDVDTASIPSMQQTDPETRRQIVDAVASDMQDPLRQITENDHVVIDFHAHCLRATAC